MFLYSFDQYWGDDRVFRSGIDLDCQAGDVLLIDGQYCLALGEEVRWPCDYVLEHAQSVHVAEKKLLSARAMCLLHWMVDEWFARYKEVVPLFVDAGIEEMLKRKDNLQLKKGNKGKIKLEQASAYTAGKVDLAGNNFGSLAASGMWYEDFLVGLWGNDQDPGFPIGSGQASSGGRLENPSPTPVLMHDGEGLQLVDVPQVKRGRGWYRPQSLLLFPDSWSLYNQLRPWLEREGLCVLTGKSTPKQRAEAWWGIKHGEIRTVACTHMGLFQDRKELAHVYVARPDSWSYKNRRGARYGAVGVVEQLISS